jgi:hypothetical protein
MPTSFFFQPYADDASVYRYDWRVQDQYTGQDFGQGENRQGFATDGEYQVKVLLRLGLVRLDIRLGLVKFATDGENQVKVLFCLG